jgi:hypothetical protein
MKATSLGTVLCLSAPDDYADSHSRMLVSISDKLLKEKDTELVSVHNPIIPLAGAGYSRSIQPWLVHNDVARLPQLRTMAFISDFPFRSTFIAR